MNKPYSTVDVENIPKFIIDAVSKLSELVDDNLILNNGKTALYWHLLSVIKRHTDDSDNKQEN